MSRSAIDFMKRHMRALLASVALVVGFVWVLRAGALPVLPPAGTLARLDSGLLTLGMIAMLVSMLTRLVRVHFLLAPIAQVSLQRVFTTLCMSLGLITFLPFRLGEVARPALLREKGKLSGWAVTGTVGAERIIDGVVFSLLLLTSLSLARPHEPLPDHIGNLRIPAAYVPQAARLATLAFVCAFAMMAAFFFWRAAARRATERVLGLFSKKLASTVADGVERLSGGFQFLLNPRYTVPYLLVTAFSVACNILALNLMARAAGLPPLTVTQTTVVFGVLALGFAVPNAPGFFGSIQLALYAGLAVYVEPAKVVHEGAAFVFVYYLIYLGLVILVTAGGLIADARFSGSRARAER